MELRYLFHLARKWGWLVILAVAIASLSSYYYSRLLPQTYVSTTTLLVGQVLSNPNPSGSDLDTMNQLARSYSQIVLQQPVLQATIDAQHLPFDWQGLAARVNPVSPGGQLLQINVSDTDPQRAKRTADELARQLVLSSPTGELQSKTAQQRQFVSDQMSSLQLQIESSQKSLNGLTNQAALEQTPRSSPT